ncbi:hypothetical protein [Aquimarina mytili]|uniref:HTTM domain-containing protein n=1 Tax=Aquimarina mytili TaxID=874423 RepID=A0A936ZQ21_9FLAO|nr:hypothetical protein [Aquimarina mytili]MBL0683327.1 hypothetical protein [Aquimarina mytili]
MNLTETLNFLTDFNNITVVITLTGIILAVGLIISTLELMALKTQMGNNGLYSWYIWREIKFRKKPRLKKGLSFLFEPLGLTIAMLFRLGLLLYFIYQLATGSGLVLWVVILLFLTQLYYHFRLPVGKDGSDQMSSIVLLCLLIIALFPDNKVIVAASLLFIAYQSIVSYLTAGVAKLISKTWRSGTIVFGIFNTKTYGSRHVVQFLKDKPKLIKVLNHSTFIFEVLFFLVLFIPPPYNIFALIIPVTFHFFCAGIMGLNSFVFAFIATYPAVLFVSNGFQKVVSRFIENMQL